MLLIKHVLISDKRIKDKVAEYGLEFPPAKAPKKVEESSQEDKIDDQEVKDLLKEMNQPLDMLQELQMENEAAREE